METESPEAAGQGALEEKAKRYGRLKRRVALAEWVLDALLLILLLGTGWSAALRDAALAATPHAALALLLYLLMFGAVFEIAGLPLDFYSGFALEQRFGLSRLTREAWLRDHLKSLAIGAGLGAALAELFYGAAARFPGTWWLWVAGGLILFVVFLAQLGPVVFLPLLFRFQPVENGELVERLRRLAARAGTRVEKVLEWKLGEKTTKENAALAGWGRTRRILLADTLLEHHTTDEIETIMAHELGHQVHHDIPRAIAVESAMAVAALWVVARVLERASPRLGLGGPADFANLPLVLLVAAAVSLLALPLVNGYLRSRERRADRFALEMTRNPEAFIHAMEKLAERNLAEKQPGRAVEFLFHNHPSIAKRIAYAKQAQP